MISNVNAKLLQIFAVTLILSSCSDKTAETDSIDRDVTPAVDFNYIFVSDGRIRTLHAVGYEVEVTDGYHVTESKNRVDQFGDTPYKISVAAFISENTAVMVHAETVADLSGASDYSDLPQAEWPDQTFRSSGHDCMEIPADAVEGEHDLLWLQSNGFEPTGTLMFGQYFATSADNNAEIVISILGHVSSCDDGAANSEFIRDIQARTTVTKIE